MSSPEMQIIRKKFEDFYKEKDFSAHSPPRFEEREFGFLLFTEGKMIRHQKFTNVNLLNEFLGKLVPSDVYYSSAYFESPEKQMEKKGWLGADLVFDIDSDHIPTSCGKVHDSWQCKKCNFEGKGICPETCPKCGETRFDSKTWVCEVCMESAKSQTSRLVNMLLEDLGFSKDSVKVYFSGHRGYHVHVENERVHSLDSMARKEIVDYVIGLGLKPKLHRVITNQRILLTTDLKGGGWKKRVSFGLHELLTKPTLIEGQMVELRKPIIDYLKKSKEIVKDSNNRGWIASKGMRSGSWEELVRLIVSQQSSKIDTVVTTDIHRLIRLDGSLHGKTALMKINAPLDKLTEFDPLKKAIAFKKGEIIVDVTEAPKFRIGDTYYGPYKNDSHVNLPSAAALFLLCKGAAKVVNVNV